MEDTTNPVEPVTQPMPPEPSPKRNSSWGVLIAILLILAMVVVGAFYAWGQRIQQQQPGYTASLSIT